MTTSLRGVSNVVLNVQMLEDGIHSGNSGIPPSSFRICRQLLSRVEDEKTGLVVPKEFWTEIPESRLSQVSAARRWKLLRGLPVRPCAGQKRERWPATKESATTNRLV